MAFAVRVGYGADKKEWEKFCKLPVLGIIKIPTYESVKEKPKELTLKEMKKLYRGKK